MLVVMAKVLNERQQFDEDQDEWKDGILPLDLSVDEFIGLVPNIATANWIKSKY